MSRTTAHRLFILSFILTTTFVCSYALPNDFFADNTKLSEGKWVKIRVEENGIHEISYDELREMGFNQPEKVGIYGKGGKQLSEKFSDYNDDLPAVAILHHNNKIYFYGHGPVNIRYRSEFANTSNPRFMRESNNTYSRYGYYFLTEGRDDVKHIDTATGFCDETKPDYTTGFDYFYHEKDSLNFCYSGRLFVGERFINPQERDLSLAYSIHGAVPGMASIECKFYATNPYGSKLRYWITDDEIIESTINGPEPNYYAAYATPVGSKINLPSAEGTLSINYAPSGTVTHAYLDYVIIGAAKKIGFIGDEAQFRVFAPNYDSDSYGAISISNSTESTMVWDITDSNNASILPHSFNENVTKAKYLTESKKQGLIMVFDSSKKQKQINWHEDIENQNLHAISGDDVPELLIITVPYLHQKAEELAEIHRIHDKMDVLVVDSHEIINEFGYGTPDAMAYRTFCKMLYDRNPLKFKNLLLFGEMHYDNRQLLSNNYKQRLLSYQTEESLNSVMTFCISDFYGMLEDTPSSKGMQYDIVNIGVGELPCRSVEDADLIINKIATYTTDDSFAHWLGNMQTIGDAPDNNEHLSQAETIADELTNLTKDETTVSKIHVSAYPESQVQKKLLKNMNNGLLYGTYLGHASIESLSSNLSVWTTKDALKLHNNRLSFMSFGACSVTIPDAGTRGSTEAMMFTNKYGLIGGLMSSRTAYSYWNYLMLSTFQQSLFQEAPSTDNTLDPTLPRISSKRTVGEAYAIAKSNIQVPHCNEFVYHLICDPALRIPVATCKIDSKFQDIYGEGLPTLNQGCNYRLSGSITDREGKTLTDFNGTVVACLFDGKITIPTHGYGNSQPVDITYNETELSRNVVEVINGQFETDIIIPTQTFNTSSPTASIRLASYDPTQRLGATGLIEFSIGEYNPESAIDDNNAPSFESIYLNSSDFTDGDEVGHDFTFYAEISDDSGILTSTPIIGQNMYLQLDNTTTYSDLSQYVTLSEGAKQCVVAFPMTDIASGRHTLTLHVADVMGNLNSRSIGFYISDNNLEGIIKVPTSPATEDIEIRVVCETANNDITKHFIIVDALGQTVSRHNTTSDSFCWDLTNEYGVRVKPGIYYVYARLESGLISKGVTPTTEIIVIK